MELDVSGFDMERSKSSLYLEVTAHPENLKILQIQLQTYLIPAARAISQSLPQFPPTIFGLFRSAYTPLHVAVDARTGLGGRPPHCVGLPAARSV